MGKSKDAPLEELSDREIYDKWSPGFDPDLPDGADAVAWYDEADAAWCEAALPCGTVTREEFGKNLDSLASDNEIQIEPVQTDIKA